MEKTSDHNWHKIAESIAGIDFGETGLTEIEVNGKKICLINHNGQLSACTQKCPHAGGILADGYIDAIGNLVCPLHRYKFNPQTGRNISGEGFFLRTFLIEERENGVFVCITEPSI